MTDYPNDNIAGQEVPPLVLEQDHILGGTHVGSVYVESGHFELAGTLQGSLSLAASTTALITGTQQGSISLAPGAAVRVTGTIQGSCSVSPGAELAIEPGGKHAGSLHNDGTVILRGTFGGSQSGAGEFQLDGGTVKKPKVRDGVNYYEW